MQRDLSIPINCASFKPRQFSRQVARFYDAELAKSGLKTSQFSLLTHITNRGPIASGALAMRMGMDASTLSRNLKPLIDNGWVEIHRGEDARSRFIAATSQGRDKQAEALVCWARAQKMFVEVVGAEKVDQLLTMIEDCSSSLSAATA